MEVEVPSSCGDVVCKGPTDLSGRNVQEFQGRELSTMYKFVSGMPMLVLDSYRGQNNIPTRSRKRGVDGKSKNTFTSSHIS